MIGKLQNVVSFKLIGGRHEAGSPMTTMLVMGDATVAPNNPSVIGTFFEASAAVNYGIEFNNVNYPNINGIFFTGMTTSGIKNTVGSAGGSTGGTVLASHPATSASPIDNLVGISMVNEQTTVDKSYPILGQGLVVGTGNGVSFAIPPPTTLPGQIAFGAATSIIANPGSNGAVPNQVAGYLIVNINGQNYKIPFFNQ
jgi:hypothetical protein